MEQNKIMEEFKVISKAEFNRNSDETLTMKYETIYKNDEYSLSAYKVEEVNKRDDGNVNDKRATALAGTLKILKFITSLRLELITFLYIGACVSKSITSVAILMDRACRVHMNYSDEVCNNLTAYEAQKTEVERMANNYQLAHALIESVPSAILSCFAGSWSDKYGRKLPIITGLIGAIIDDALSVIWASMPHARVEFYLIPPLFSSLSGGFIVAITVLYSYASDISSARNRTVKYALVEASLGFTFPLGVFTGGMVYKYGGATSVFATGLGVRLVTLLLLVCFLKETRGIGNTDNWRKKVRVFFSLTNLLEGFRATIKKRPHRGRLQVWMLFVAMSICILTQVGSAEICFLYTHHHYNWGNTKYSTVSSIFLIMNTVTMMIAVPILSKMLHVGDPILGIIGSLSSLGKMVFFSFAATSELFYVGNFVNLFSSIASLACRARISKIIPPDDLGKIFALLSTAESLIPILSQAAVSQLFNATLGTVPDPTYTVFSVLSVIALGIFIWLYLLPKMDYKEEKQNCTNFVKNGEVSRNITAENKT